MPGPLGGVRVLDLTHFLAGPYATMILADLGADVIKLEDPEHPDETRSLGPFFHDGQSLYYASLNWGKQSFSVRLADTDGRRAVLDLVRTADVLVDNFRPGVTAKLGLDHETLRTINPKLVTCSLSGFGETGPYRNRAGYDYTIQALAGVMSLTGEPDAAPGKAGISYVDHSGGLTAALAVCAALLQRERTGVAQHVDLALFDIQMSMLTYLAAWQLNAAYTPTRTPSGSHPSLVPAQTFRTRDGHISVFVGNDAMWHRLVDVLGDTRLADPAYHTTGGRYEHRDAVLDLLQEILLRADNADWVRALSERQVPCAPVNTVDEALADPQVEARGLVQTGLHKDYAPYRHLRGPLPTMSPGPTAGAPTLGEHTAGLLQEMGYNDDEIAHLLGAGSAGCPGEPADLRTASMTGTSPRHTENHRR